MVAGRELDALVAEKVMGWERVLDGEETARVFGQIAKVEGGVRGVALRVPKELLDGQTNPIVWIDSRNETGTARKVLPHYSTDIAAAWLVWDRITEKDYDLALQRDWNLPREWVVTKSDSDCRAIFAYGSTAPLAICRAALQAVGHG